jgi:hypothetical protein
MKRELNSGAKNGPHPRADRSHDVSDRDESAGQGSAGDLVATGGGSGSRILSAGALPCLRGWRGALVPPASSLTTRPSVSSGWRTKSSGPLRTKSTGRSRYCIPSAGGDCSKRPDRALRTRAPSLVPRETVGLARPKPQHLGRLPARPDRASMAHVRPHPPAEIHARRNARLWRSWSPDLLFRLQVQPLDSDQRRPMAG